MDVRVNQTIRVLLFLGVLAASGGLIYAAAWHGVAEHWAQSSNPDLWLRAANSEPSNPDTWYHLGRYRQLDFQHGDLPLAISYYQHAAAIEPIAGQYWADLAAAYEATGNLAMAEQAYQTAQRDYPISGDVAWRYGNFLLRQNRLDEAFRQIQHAVSVDPKLTALAVSRCWRSTQDVDRILKFVVPPNPDAYWGAIQFFVSMQQPDAAMAAWKKFAALGVSSQMAQASPLMDYLIESGRADDAQTVWKQAVSSAGIAPSPASGGSLVWDGGFEQEILNAGFAWRYQPIQGAELDWDEQTMHSGARSLQITFDGSANLDFQQMWQYVAVEPSMDYRLSAYFRTDSLSTESGIHFEVYDVTHADLPHPSTPNVVGTQPWSLEETGFTTGPQTRLLRLVLRREPSHMLSNKIRGMVWVDDVALVPVSLAQPGKP